MPQESKKEIRQYEFSEVRMETFQAGTEAEPVQVKKLVGYAARFDTYSEDLGGFREIIRKGAFKDNLGANPVFALANHNRDLILGATKNGSLKLMEDQYGLRIELSPLDTTTAREWMGHVESGVVDKMSFAFKVDGKEGERWLRGDSGDSVRELHKVKVFDVSLVNQPAYQATSVVFRSLEEIRAEGETELSRLSEELKAKADEQTSIDAEIRSRNLKIIEASL